MTDFKPGDRVRGFASGRPERRERTEGTVEAVEPTGWVQLENGFSLDPTRPIELIETPRPLVGPAPSPPAAPKIQAPFVTDSNFYATVYDASNRPVLSLDTVQLRKMGLDTEELEKFAAYVALALNASVFNEE